MKRYYTYLVLVVVVLLGLSSCQKEADDNFGYLQLDLNTLVSTVEPKAVMAAPANYDPKRLYVEILDASGSKVMSTDDFNNDNSFKGNIKLVPGTYTVNAHSYGWDASDSGFSAPFYSGTATATVAAKSLKTVKVTCTLANVKVTVNFDTSFRTSFKKATATVASSADGVSSRMFTMGSDDSRAAYFPAGNDLTLHLEVVNWDNIYYEISNEVKDTKPREHIKINYKLAQPGTIGGVTVSVDDDTRTYNFNIPIPRKPGISFECSKVVAWSNFANLNAEITGRTSEFVASNVVMQWKKVSDSQWNEIPNSSLTYDGDSNYSYRLTGLQPATSYHYRVHYACDDPIDTEPVEFTTESQTAIYNGGFEYWYTSGKIQYPDQSGTSYWDTSNPGSADYIGSVTVQETGFKHGGSSCTKLQSQWALIKLAAGSLYTGKYNGLIGTKGAKLDWGVPFTSRPTHLKGYWCYAPGAINRGTQPDGAPAKGENDACQIFCVLLTEQLHVGGNAEATGYEKSTTIDWENDPRIIAYGELSQNTSSNGSWEELNIPLKYHTLTKRPAYMAIVCSSSKWGDYFYGSDSSVLYLDDISFGYSDKPESK